ncbi:MAG TPA: tetratricopeptide repeat protein [Bacteroidales bacterium]|nr:tetratricopeptide repeat protein [Bacteroidales bacterium]
MELLKKSLITAIILFFSATLSEAQDFVKKKDAFQKSYIQEATGEYLASIASLREVYDEKSYEINLRLGWLTYLSGSFTEAKAYYNKAVTLMPYALESRFGLVLPLAALGNWTEVLAQYDKILEISPNNSIVLHRLGLIYYGRGDFESARKYFDKVLNLYPFDYDALTMSAWTYLKLNNLRESKVLFQKALLNTPNGTSAVEGLDLLK